MDGLSKKGRAVPDALAAGRSGERFAGRSSRQSARRPCGQAAGRSGGQAAGVPACDALAAGRLGDSPENGLGVACGIDADAPDFVSPMLEGMKGDFIDLMRRLHRMRAMSRAVPEGVTPAEARAVCMVWLAGQRGEVARPGSVASHMCTTPSALSQTLKSLEEKGLIVRHRTRDDFRAVALELTDAGSAVAQETERLYAEHAKAVVAYVGEEDFAHLLRTVDRILEFHEQTLSASESPGVPASSASGASPVPASPLPDASPAPGAPAPASSASGSEGVAPASAGMACGLGRAASAFATPQHASVPEGGPSCV